MANAVYNPKNVALEHLPTIYGFNNGGSPGLFDGYLLAQDGTELGGHICSHEYYMPGDLGVLEGSRSDRHEGFKAHYPDGYKMEFVGYEAAPSHEGLKDAFAANAAKHENEGGAQ